MSQNKQFDKLLQQAASTLNIAGAGDTSELKELQVIFGKLNKELNQLEKLPEDIADKASGAAESASKLVEILINKDVEDAYGSLNSLSEIVEALQEMVDKISLTDQIDKLDLTFPEINFDLVSSELSLCISESESCEFDEQNNETETVDETAGMIIPEEDAPLVLDFINEAGEHIEAAEAGLLELESAPDDVDSINTIFRGFHTIKGMAGFLNLEDIGSLAHAAENLLDLARQGKLQLAGSNMDVVFESIDLLKKMISDLQQAVENGTAVPSQSQLPSILERIKSCAEGKPVETNSAVKKTETKTETKTESGISQTKEPQTQSKPVSAEPVETEASQNKSASETASTQSAGQTEDVPQSKQQPTAKIKQMSEEKIKVSTNRLDELVNMAGELVIAQSMVTQQALRELGDDHILYTKINHQGKIVRDLQELSMLMRMVPIQGVFGKMARLVRDLSHKSEKQINFITQGEDTELDRNVVEQISDPLVHMVRNSIDHGIEASAEDRKAAGKDPVGLVQLRAFHQAGNVIIEIEDDGRGLDKEKILAKAVKNGIVEPGQEMSDSEIYKLIFNAGLSTAEQITSISGRGVGMDVVKKNIETLRGKIEISSAKGKGTVFTIRLPLTLAIIEGQIVRIGEERYIIPILSIERCLRPSSEQITTVQNRGEVAHVHGELLPVVRLYNQFGVTPDTEDITDSSLVVVEEDGKKGALMVDELLDQQQTVIKSLGESFGEIKGISGGAIMGDGKISLILDVPGLLELASGQVLQKTA